VLKLISLEELLDKKQEVDNIYQNKMIPFDYLSFREHNILIPYIDIYCNKNILQEKYTLNKNYAILFVSPSHTIFLS